MNIDPRFKTDPRARLSLPDPLGLSAPSWLPSRGIAWLGLGTALLCAVFVLAFDKAIALQFGQWRDEPWVGFFRAITIAGNSAFWYTPAALGLIASLWISRRSPSNAVNWEWRRRARSFLFLIASMAASGTIVNVLKISFGRHRPRFLFNDGVYGFEPFGLTLANSGFPSGHTQSITAAMVALGFLWPRGRFVFWSVAVVVAASRFITAVHYAADVIGGAFVAIAVAWTLKRYFERNGITLAWAKPDRGPSAAS